jgi:hypothetical protein
MRAMKKGVARQMSSSAMVFLSPMIRLIILLIFYCLLLLERSHYLGNSSRSTWTKVETVSCLENDTIVSLCILGNSARCNGQKVCRIAPVHTTGGASTCTEGSITQRGGEIAANWQKDFAEFGWD